VNDTKNGSVQIETNQLYYIEVCGHKLAYHTENGVAYEYGSLSNLETLLKGNHFMRCNSCYLVNPKFIEKINSNELLVVMKNGETLKISQPRRKSFISELTNWLGQGCY
jgi:DNA-binding LytR/AlgR family response regulator